MVRYEDINEKDLYCIKDLESSVFECTVPIRGERVSFGRNNGKYNDLHVIKPFSINTGESGKSISVFALKTFCYDLRKDSKWHLVCSSDKEQLLDMYLSEEAADGDVTLL